MTEKTETLLCWIVAVIAFCLMPELAADDMRVDRETDMEWTE